MDTQKRCLTLRFHLAKKLRTTLCKHRKLIPVSKDETEEKKKTIVEEIRDLIFARRQLFCKLINPQFHEPKVAF